MCTLQRCQEAQADLEAALGQADSDVMDAVALLSTRLTEIHLEELVEPELGSEEDYDYDDWECDVQVARGGREARNARRR